MDLPEIAMCIARFNGIRSWCFTVWSRNHPITISICLNAFAGSIPDAIAFGLAIAPFARLPLIYNRRLSGWCPGPNWLSVFVVRKKRVVLGCFCGRQRSSVEASDYFVVRIDI